MSHKQRQNTTTMQYEAIPKTYDQLLALYALRPIHNDRELEQATEIIDILAGHDLNADQQVAALVGEAGVGKSRLVYEFAHAHHTQGWTVLESASVSYGKATPYFPVIDLLKRYSHVEEGDDARTRRAKVTGQVLTLDAALQDTARTLAEHVLEQVRTRKNRGQEAYTLCLLGDIALHRHPPEVAQAEAYYRQALALAEELGMRPLQAHCHLGLSTLYANLGRPEQARPELNAAIDLYRAMQMQFWLPQAEAALAQMVL